MRSNVRSLVALALTVAVLVYPATVLAIEGEAEGTASEGAVAGQTDGRTNTSGILWFGAGCLFHVFGIGAAYLITPNPPAMRLLGKSSDYVAAYTDAYGSSAKSVQTKNAWTGCCVSSAAYGVYVVVVLVLAAAAATQY